jgi:hypothetical protein
MNTNEVLEEARHALNVILGVMLAGMHLRDTPLGRLQPKTVKEFDEIRGWLPKIDVPDASTIHSQVLEGTDLRVRAVSLESICRGQIVGLHRAIEQHSDFKDIQSRLPSYRFLWLVRNAFAPLASG